VITEENNPLASMQAYVDGKMYISIHNGKSDCSGCAFKSVGVNVACAEAKRFTKGSCVCINFVEVENLERNKLLVNKPKKETMNTITITVPSESLENMLIELSQEEVTALYKLRKDQAAKITELEKKNKDTEQSLKYAQEAKENFSCELQQANALLTALAVPEKTNEEEAYYRKPLALVTRIALYIAASK